MLREYCWVHTYFNEMKNTRMLVKRMYVVNNSAERRVALIYDRTLLASLIELFIPRSAQYFGIVVNQTVVDMKDNIRLLRSKFIMSTGKIKRTMQL